MQLLPPTLTMSMKDGPQAVAMTDDQTFHQPTHLPEVEGGNDMSFHALPLLGYSASVSKSYPG